MREYRSHACACQPSQLGIHRRLLVRELFQKTRAASPTERALTLERGASAFSVMQNHWAAAGQTSQEGWGRGGSRGHFGEVLHFVCFVEVDGILWEMDGTLHGPVRHGPLNGGSALAAAAQIISGMVAPGDYRISLVAVSDPSGIRPNGDDSKVSTAFGAGVAVDALGHAAATADDADEQLRMAIAASLGDVPMSDAVPAVADDSHALMRVRSAALEMLGQEMQPSGAQQALAAARAALGEAGSTDVEALVAAAVNWALDHPSEAFQGVA